MPTIFKRQFSNISSLFSLKRWSNKWRNPVNMGRRSRKEAIQKIDLTSLLILFSSHKAANTIISPSEIQHCSLRLLKMNLQDSRPYLIEIKAPAIIKRKLINQYDWCRQESNSQVSLNTVYTTKVNVRKERQLNK